MKCIGCVYHYITPEDRYPCCHFEPIANWDAIPMIAEGNPLS